MRKVLKMLLAVFLVFDLACAVVIGINGYFNKNSGTEENSTVYPEGETDAVGNVKDENWEAMSRVSFLAVGDNLIHDTVYDQAESRSGESGKYDFTYAYENVAKYVEAADVSILNQETIIFPGHKPASYPQFNSPVEVGEEMLRIGFDVFNIATNHSLDMGEEGLVGAINYWKEKKVVTTGAYLNSNDFKIPYRTVNGIKFAYLGFTESTNGLSLPSDSSVILCLASDEELLSSKIAEAKQNADIVIVNAHWGEEYTHEPNENQREMAQKLADWGADVVIGTHPHVIQPLEYVTASDGRQTLVAYSLGNFISAQSYGSRMLGGMLTFDVVRNNSTGTIELENVKFRGTVTHYASGMSNIRVYLLDDYTDDLAANHGVKSKTPNFSLAWLNELLTEVIDPQFLD